KPSGRLPCLLRPVRGQGAGGDRRPPRRGQHAAVRGRRRLHTVDPSERRSPRAWPESDPNRDVAAAQVGTWLEDAVMGGRLVGGLRRYLRNPLTLAEARATLRCRLERREADFL